MNYLNMFDELVLKANALGINKKELGVRIWGKGYPRIYIIKNPTVRTLQLISDEIDKIVKEKSNKIK